jgi:hypothetical protein
MLSNGMSMAFTGTFPDLSRQVTKPQFHGALLSVAVTANTPHSIQPLHPKPLGCTLHLPDCGKRLHLPARFVSSCSLTFLLTDSSLANEEQNALQVLGVLLFCFAVFVF